MSDYGHDLLFGSFVTPDARAPHRVVELARLSERAGLDVVTVQDHPYQPGHLDMWTLLSWVAASTSSIRVAPNVANLALRPAPVLARAAAALDLLSGGRVELGLGTGAFWDAVAAMGGPRLTPGEAVTALEEAIAVMRGLWDTTASGVLRAGGEHHRVDGARRGPAPAHDISLWLGAYKPRLLKVTGRLADGWLPSLAYLPDPETALAQGNARIDEAALEAGREPADVRRLLNVSGRFAARSTGLLDGPPDQWAEELAGLALSRGISAFVLGSDDPRELEQFAAEVAPAVRELVAAERDDDVAASPGPAATVVVTSPLRLDEATRPVAPPPDGPPPGPRQQAVGQHLVDVHDHLRSELDQVHDLVRQVRDGRLSAGDARSAVNAMTMRQNDWTLGAYCAAYCRLVTQHHSLEDAAVFPHLRAAQPALAPVIDRLEAEHHVVHEVLEALDLALVEHLAEPGDLSGLQAAADELTAVLLSHLTYEEEQLVDPLARYGFYAGQV